MNHKGRLLRLAALLLALLLATALPLGVLAEEAAPLDEETEQGVTLSTVEDLLEFAENCRLDSWSSGLTVTLTEDLDLSDVDFSGIPTFGGEFIGGGHTISGLNLTADGSVQGFFRYLQKGALVQGLRLVGNVAPGGSKGVVGGLVGSNRGTLQNCHFAGIVTGGDSVGGLVGRNETSGVITGCTNRGICYGSHLVGGMAGENAGVINSSTNRMGINTTAAQNETATSLDSLSLSNLTTSSNIADISDIGGIAGHSSGVLRACTNRGVIGYQHVGYNVGGIAGSQSGFIEGCINYGTVQARKEGGGIVGQLEPSSDLEYMPDTLQIVSGQLYTLQGLTNQAASDAEASNSALTGQIHSLQRQVNSAYNAVSTLVNTTVDTYAPTLTDLSGLVNAGSSLGDLQELADRLPHERPTHHAPEIDGVDLNNALVTNDSITAARNDLDGSMTGIFNTVDSLNNSTANTTSALANDIRAIANQVNRIGQTLSGAGQRDEDIVQDISDEDTEQDTAGKVLNCVNYGAVAADINAGGIAGAMAPENDLDPEDDISINGNSSLNFTYKTRAVLRECENHAVVSAQKRGAGGIVGEMQMGTVQSSLNLGALDAENAEQVGGIVGSSGSSIRNCYAKCDIAGASKVGGIVGSGATVTNCFTQVRITGATERYGALIGLDSDFTDPTDAPANSAESDEEPVTVSGNYFVYEPNAPLGGVDGVSYAEAAEGVSYADFMAFDRLPEAFDSITLRFLAEDGSELARFTHPYGSTFAETELPKVPEKVGHYGEWDGLADANLKDLRFDETFTAVYTPLYSALASTTQRGSADSASVERPVALLEGAYETAEADWLSPLPDSVELPPLPPAEPYADEPVLIDRWQLKLPATAPSAAADKGTENLLHYLPPEGYTTDVRLYLRGADGSWRCAETTQDGSYLVCAVEEGDDALCAIYVPASDWTLPLCAAAAVLVVLLLLIHLLRKWIKKRKKNRQEKQKEKQKENEEKKSATQSNP